MAKVLTEYEKKLNEQKMPAGKKKVLLASLHLFANHGFHGTTTAKIAKKAGVSEGTIYKYFGSKKELLTALLIPVLTEIRDNFFNKLDNFKNLDELISFIIVDRQVFIQQNFDFIKIIMQELLIGQEEIEPIFQKIFGETNGFKNSVKKLQKKYPEIDPNLSPIQIIRCIFGPAIAYICQENLLNIKTNKLDIQLLHKQIIAGLSNE